MPYPLHPDKWRDATVSGPASFLGSALKMGWDPGPIPVATVFTYDPTLTAHVRAQGNRFRTAPNLAGNGASFAIGPHPAPVWLSCTGVGPSACTMELENLEHLGCHRFVSIGIAGSLDPTLHVGDLVLLTSALRDDGLSQHYLAPQRYATPSAPLTERWKHSDYMNALPRLLQLLETVLELLLSSE